MDYTDFQRVWLAPFLRIVPMEVERTATRKMYFPDVSSFNLLGAGNNLLLSHTLNISAISVRPLKIRGQRICVICEICVRFIIRVILASLR